MGQLTDWKNYAMVLLTATTLLSLNIDVTPPATHYCEARELVAHCYSLSSTDKTCYTIPGGQGGKRCIVAPFWQDIPNEPDELAERKVLVIAYTDDDKWFCDGIGIDANCVREEDLVMPFG